MAQNTRQTNLLVQQDWTKIYQAFSNADFTSYDFETLRTTMIEYLQQYYPDTFNDYLESSEYLALIDMIAFLGQSLAFRTDLNARENFIDTAQRRDSILKLARMLSYNPQRTNSASGLLKINSVRTTESIIDSSGNNLANATIHWNDITNENWLEQFTNILNASLVSTQTIGKPGNSQKISGIQTDEYAINLNPASLPIAGFNVSVQGIPVNFEGVSGTALGETYIYEKDPTITGQFNVLYRNDNNGNNSNNTGFFVFFKQGTLQATDFDIVNAIPNNYVTIATNNINSTDHWLYQLNVNKAPITAWEETPALPGINVIYNQLENKNLYQINTLNNDQVNLVFGDGSFSNIPAGAYRFYFRTSNGQSYTINPDDLSSVVMSFNYLGKNNANQTLTVTASLKYTITNATAAQSLASIKASAPQQYYTQNRMITAEDYNIFPLTSFNSIQKIKTVNRTSSGVSLYLDALDPTGSYSSTNVFCGDGIISANTVVSSTTFDFLNTNDIYSAIYNNIIPIIGSTEMTNYYYANYPRYNSTYANVTFVQSNSSTTSSSGYLKYASATQQVGPGINGNLQYVAPGASLKFTAPVGQYFDSQHVLTSGTPSVNGDVTSFYAAVTNVVSNGDAYTPSLVTFGTIVPTGAILSDELLLGANSIIPSYKNDLSSSLISTIITQINAKVTFGLAFNQVTQQWVNIPPSQIEADNTWLLRFTYSNGTYTVNSKILKYIFSSAKETTFYFDTAARVYDSSTGLTLPDTIKLLKINTQPNSNVPIGTDITWQIYNTITDATGYADISKVLIKFPTTQMDNVPDNPDLYTSVADSSLIRSGLYFQWQHNSPSRNRIDPTPVNIMDVYILTSDYATSYIEWIIDISGTKVQPTAPSSSSLEIAYSSLDNYKAVSDTLIYNPAKFKPLFGAKADPSLRARFQVVINPASSMTPNEMKSQVIAAINKYFDLSNWDFGDTFYFSELAAYLHNTLAPNLSSVLIVPADTGLVFGNYFQINSEPWEIITSAATVNDIDVVSAVTAAQLNLGNPLIGTY